MEADDLNTMGMVEVVLHGVAIDDAFVVGDIDEARYRCQLVAWKAIDLDLPGPARAANELKRLLGPEGSEPDPLSGAAAQRLSREIDGISFDLI